MLPRLRRWAGNLPRSNPNGNGSSEAKSASDGAVAGVSLSTIGDSFLTWSVPDRLVDASSRTRLVACAEAIRLLPKPSLSSLFR